jgi:hypothetical protein
MKRVILFLIFFVPYLTNNCQIIDHNCTKLNCIPSSWIASAKAKLHIAYEHTSHGSQLIDGMSGLQQWKGDLFAFNDGGTGSALDLSDHAITGWSDLGNPDWTSWANSTRTYLSNPSNSDVNVVIWSWCGQVSYASESDIITYLGLMSGLERDYPNIKFVYMTSHLDGSGLTGNLHLRNEQIRSYCKTNNKFLYDFEDIESYDPDGVYYGAKHPTDGCNYDFNGDGVTEATGADPALPVGVDRNWALDWQNAHILNTDWYNCSCAHSQALNANQKAYAAWWLWARLAGWDGLVPVAGITVSGAGGSSLITTDNGTLLLSAEVLPLNGTNKSVTWSIINGTGQASINSDGLITAIDNGTVTAKATANDGSGIFGTLTVTLSNQINLPTASEQLHNSEQFKVISGQSQLEVQLSEDFLTWNIRLFNLKGTLISGKLVDSAICLFDVASLPSGIYIIILAKGADRKVIKVVKP